MVEVRFHPGRDAQATLLPPPPSSTLETLRDTDAVVNLLPPGQTVAVSGFGAPASLLYLLLCFPSLAFTNVEAVLSSLWTNGRGLDWVLGWFDEFWPRK